MGGQVESAGINRLRVGDEKVVFELRDEALGVTLYA